MKKSLLKQLNTRLNAIKLISNVINFKTRLMIANGIFSSKLIFQIGLWGGTEEFLLSSLQIVKPLRNSYYKLSRTRLHDFSQGEQVHTSCRASWTVWMAQFFTVGFLPQC